MLNTLCSQTDEEGRMKTNVPRGPQSSTQNKGEQIRVGKVVFIVHCRGMRVF